MPSASSEGCSGSSMPPCYPCAKASKRARAMGRAAMGRAWYAMKEMPMDDNEGTRSKAESDEQLPEGMRQGGGGKPVPADDPLDRSLEGEDADTVAKNATPPTEGPAAAGALPG